jgi:phage gp29-like protein
MSKAILGQTATSEGTPGMLGSERERADVRQDLVRGDCEALANTIRYQIFRPLVGYNFGWDKPVPWFKLRYERPKDLVTLSEIYERMHRINFPISQEHVSERFKIPLPGKGETVLQGPSAREPAPMKRIVAKRGEAEQEKIDALVSRILKDGGIAELRDSLERIVSQAASLEDLRAKIFNRYKDVEIEKMKEILSRAILIANLTGRFLV